MNKHKASSKTSTALFIDRAFKLLVLVGVPALGTLYFSQRALKTSPDLKPFQVVKAPTLDGVKLTTQKSIPAWNSQPITVVNFWATWCAPCVEEMPAMAELAGRFQNKGTRFVFVSVDDNWEKVEKFLHDNVIDIPAENLFWDPSKEVSAKWGSDKFPETYIVNNNGWILEKVIGFQEWTRPVVASYFERLSRKFAGSAAYFGPSNIFKHVAAWMLQWLKLKELRLFTKMIRRI